MFTARNILLFLIFSLLVLGLFIKEQANVSLVEYQKKAAQSIELSLQKELAFNEDYVSNNMLGIFNAKNYESIKRTPWYLDSEVLFQYYSGDSLVLWNDSYLPNIRPIQDATEQLVHFQGRYYLVQQFGSSLTSVLVYTPISWDAEEFKWMHSADFLLSDELNSLFTVSDQVLEYPINYNDHFILSLVSKQDSELVQRGAYRRACAVLFLLAYFLAMLWALFFIPRRWLLKYPVLSIIGLIVFFSAIRYALDFGRDFIHLSSLQVFDPLSFASSSLGIESIGDLLLHFSIILFACLFLFINRRVYHHVYGRITSNNPTSRILFIEILFLNLFLALSVFLLKIFVLDAAISLEGLFLIYQAETQTIIIYFLVVFLIILNSYFLYRVSKICWRTKGFRWWLLFQTIVALGLALAIYPSFDHFLFIPAVFIVFIILILTAYFKLKPPEEKVEFLLVSILLYSILFGIVFNSAIQDKKIDYAKTLGKNLFKPTDPLADFLLDQLVTDVASDALLQSTFSSLFLNEKAIRDRVVLKYVDRYLERYNLTRFEYRKFKLSNIETSEEPVQPKTVFREAGRLGFMLVIPIRKTDQTTDTVLMEMVQGAYQPTEEFARFALDYPQIESNPFSEFSAATYSGDLLVRQFGDYPYTVNRFLNLFTTDFDAEFSIRKEGELKHVLYSPNDSYLQIVSIKSGGVFGLLAMCSGFFILSLILVSLIWLVYNVYSNRGLRTSEFSFQSRIEFALIGLVLIVLLVVGIITVSYTQFKYRRNLEEKAIEEAQALSIRFEEVFQLSEAGGIDKEVSLELSDLSRTSKLYFDLYDLSGARLADNELISVFARSRSSRIDPVALWQLKIMEKSFFHQNEVIQDNEFISVYVPLLDGNRELRAFLNVPFYNTQRRLNAQTSSFLSSLVNIYGILIILSSIIVFGLASMLTAPLRLMMRVIEDTKAGNRDNLEIAANDEIGLMLKEYNLMVAELDRNAELLARSEKDAAWRQMARQVAHEIKNPLTPVKLSIQHLLRSWKDGSPDFENKLERISSTVMQQIESLDSIATEFSDFAQMPVGKPEETDLSLILSQMVRLYKDQVRITLLDETYEDRSRIWADKEQMSRVFNNLVKNAIQARPDIENVEILIRLRRLVGHYLIEVNDNGNGIPEELHEKIFVPNFTTKNSGMGLGLAIVKKIVEQSGGEISFKSRQSEGTTFYVSLPVHDIESE